MLKCLIDLQLQNKTTRRPARENPLLHNTVTAPEEKSRRPITVSQARRRDSRQPHFLPRRFRPAQHPRCVEHLIYACISIEYWVWVAYPYLCLYQYWVLSMSCIRRTPYLCLYQYWVLSMSCIPFSTRRVLAAAGRNPPKLCLLSSLHANKP